MNKITYKELKEAFIKHNRENGGEDCWVVDYCYLMETKNENSKNI